MKLQPDQVAVVTGAASGIGLALARAVHARGLHVALADVDAQRVADAASTLTAGEGRAVPFVVDVSDPASVDALAREVGEQLGPVNLLVNNAGILRPGAAHEQPLSDYRAVMDVNVFGVIHGYRSFVPRMLEHGGPCHVVNTSSLGGLIAASHAAAYMVSKHAVIALSEALAADTAATALGVTVLCPGGTATDIFASEMRRRESSGLTASRETEERFRKIADPSRPGVLDPADIAEVAVRAVEADELYALAFGAEPTQAVRARLAAIEAALQVREEQEAAALK